MGTGGHCGHKWAMWAHMDFVVAASVGHCGHMCNVYCGNRWALWAQLGIVSKGVHCEHRWALW